MKKLSKIIVTLITLLFITPIFAPIVNAEATDDIVGVATENSDFNILVSALEEAELVETLQGEGPYTVFAPTDAAFEKLLDDLDITAEELLAQPDLAKVLTYHVVPGKIMAEDLTDGLTVETVNGEELTFDLTADPMANEAKVTSTNIEATNGVIHVIDTVLIPSDFELQEVEVEEVDKEETPEAKEDIVGIALGNPDFSILVSALQKAGLVETLQGEGPFTVFAPTNTAFENLLKELDITAEELLAQPDLDKVLTYHVISGKVMASDLTDGLKAATVNGEELVFDLSGDPMVNQSKITSTDIEATNGVVHVIDKVLVPSNFKLQTVDMEEDSVAETGIESNILLVIGMIATAGALVFLMTQRKKA